MFHENYLKDSPWLVTWLVLLSLNGMMKSSDYSQASALVAPPSASYLLFCLQRDTSGQKYFIYNIQFNEAEFLMCDVIK